MNTKVRGASFQTAADWRNKDVRGTASTMLQGTTEQDAFATLDRVGNQLERKIGWFYGKLAIVNTTKKSSSGPAFTRNWMSVSDTRNTRTREVAKQLFEKSAGGIRDDVARREFLGKVNNYLQENPDTRIRGGKDNKFSQLVKELRTLREVPEPDVLLAQQQPGQEAQQVGGRQQEMAPPEEQHVPQVPSEVPSPVQNQVLPEALENAPPQAQGQPPLAQDGVPPQVQGAVHGQGQGEAQHAAMGDPPVIQPFELAQHHAPVEPPPNPWIELPDESVETARSASVYLKRATTDLLPRADHEPALQQMLWPPADQASLKGEPLQALVADQGSLQEFDDYHIDEFDVRSSRSNIEYDEDPLGGADLDEAELQRGDAQKDARLYAFLYRNQFIEEAERTLPTIRHDLETAETTFEEIAIAVDGWTDWWIDAIDKPATAIDLQSDDALKSALINQDIYSDLERLQTLLESNLRELEKLEPGAQRAIAAAVQSPDEARDGRVAELNGVSAQLKDFAKDCLEKIDQLKAQLDGLFNQARTLRDERLGTIAKESQDLRDTLAKTISQSTAALEDIRPRLQTALDNQNNALSRQFSGGQLAESHQAIKAQVHRLEGRNVMGEPQREGLIDQLEKAFAAAIERRQELSDMGLSPEDPMVANFDNISRQAQVNLDEARALLGTAVTRNPEVIQQAQPVKESVQVEESIPNNPRLQDLLTNPNRVRSNPDPAMGQNAKSLIERQDRLGLILAQASAMIGQGERINAQQRMNIETLIGRANGIGGTTLTALRESALADLDAGVKAAEQGLDDAIESTLAQLRIEVQTAREGLQELRDQSRSHQSVMKAEEAIFNAATDFERSIAEIQDAMNELSNNTSHDDLESAQSRVLSAIDKAREQAKHLDELRKSASAVEGFQTIPGLSDNDWSTNFNALFESDEEDQQADQGKSTEDKLTEGLQFLADALDERNAGKGVRLEKLAERADEILSQIDAQTLRVQTADEQVETFVKRFGEAPRSNPGPVRERLKDALAGTTELQAGLNAFGDVAGSISGSAFELLEGAARRRQAIEADIARFDRDLKTFRSWADQQER